MIAARGMAALLVAGFGLSLYAWAQAPDVNTDKPAIPKVAPTGLAPNSPGALAKKVVAFEMRNKPWGAVFEWVSDTTGLPFISHIAPPTGSFTFVNPRVDGKEPRKYTVPEVLDIINEGLLPHKYVLIRREASFTIWPADEQIDPAILRRITVDELDDCGKNEIISLIMPLTSLVAEDFAPEAKKMLGPFSTVFPLARANQLVAQDSAANLRRLVKTVKDIEEAEKVAETFSHKCVYVRAAIAELALKNYLGNQQQIVQTQGGPPGSSSSSNQPDRRDPRATPAPTRVRAHTVTSDERTNTVHVNGPPDKVSLAKAFVVKLDVPTVPGGPPLALGEPFMQTHNIPQGNADPLVKALQVIYKPSPTLSITAISTTQIMVYATPEDQISIAKHLNSLKPPTASTEMIPLTVLEASKAADTVKAMFGDVKTGAPYIEADPLRNVLMVRGTPEQIKEVQIVVKAIGENPNAYGSMRVITLDKGSAATLADAIQRLMPKMRPNPVKVINPGAAEPAPKPAPIPQLPKKEEVRFNYGPGVVSVDHVQPVSAQQLSDPATGKTLGSGPEIVITAFGNKLVVVSEDQQALILVQELVRLLTQTSVGEGDFEVIRLKHAGANDIARILDEAFNGSTKGGAGGKGGDKGGGGVNPISMLTGGIGGMMQSMIGGGAGGQRVERIRVVADPSINAIIVRAVPLDMMTVRDLLTKYLDTDEVDTEALPRTYMVGPLKNATAIEVATVIRDVYRDHMGMNSTQQRMGSMPGFGFPFSPQPSQPQQPQMANAMRLSVGIDERSNSLIVNCAPPLYKDIKQLIDTLEQTAADNKQIVRVVKTIGMDPLLVDQALEAIQGRPTTGVNRTGMGLSGMGGGFGSPFGGGSGFGGSPFGGGGMSPFGDSPFGGGGMMSPGGFGAPSGGFRGPTGGGGRGGGGTRGGGIRGGTSDNRGRDFFGQTVKDDRRISKGLFDPTEESEFVAYQDDSKLPAPKFNGEKKGDPADAKDKDGVVAPRLPVQVEPLPELGGVLLRGSPEDVAAAIRLIEFITRIGTGAQISIELIPVKNADPTSIVNTLNQLFSRVGFGPNANTLIQGRGGITQMPQTTTQPQTTPGAMPGQTPTLGTPTGATATAAGSVVMIPIPRLSSILVAVPKSRLDDLRTEIARLDQPTVGGARPVAFALKRAPAARVAQLIQTFWADRYPQEQRGQHQIRVTYDDNSNTVFVQASAADLEEIRQLIERIDAGTSAATNELRIVPLKNAVADDVSALLIRSIATGFIPTTQPGQLGGLGGQLGGQLGGLGGQFGQLGGQFGQLGQTGGQQQQPLTKVSQLRFLGNRKDAKPQETGILDDIRINSDPRLNSLIISAPEKTMQLLLAVIRELDVAPNARAEVNVFSLKKADAAQLLNTLQQLFLGSGARATTGAQGQFPGAQQQILGQTGTTAQRTPLQLTITGNPVEGAPIIDLRVTVDERTNSLLVAGSRNDLAVIEALVSRLEDADVQQRRNEAFRLRNAQAADVAAALSDFLKKTLDVLRTGNQLTAYQEIQRDVVIVAEPISNTLLISATPQYFDDILRLASQLDIMPPQVAIQVLVAEVDLNDNNEFGAEVGLQSPILFTRSLIPSGVVVNNAISPIASPGLNFNNVLTPLGNTNIASPSLVGYQGLGNLGVGRVSPTNNVGGFVFAAQSESVSLLVRALRTQGRIEVLSRPQIQTLDNQTAIINVGQEIPIIGTSNTTANGIVQQSVDRRNVGVILQVTPRISPDGRVLMRVVPEVSSIIPTPVQLGNGLVSTALNIQHLETTVSAYDGETVLLGGLITKRDAKTESKVPWLGDIPLLGAAFRYRTHTKAKTELVVILTPHIVRNKADGERVLAEESRRVSWAIGDVLKVHGPIDGSCLVPGGSPPPIVHTEPSVILPGDASLRGRQTIVPVSSTTILVPQSTVAPPAAPTSGPVIVVPSAQAAPVAPTVGYGPGVTPVSGVTPISASTVVTYSSPALPAPGVRTP